MVDNIIDLSITYSIIPAKKVENEEPRKKIKFDPEIPIAQRKEEKNEVLIPPSPSSEIKKPPARVSLLKKKKDNQPNEIAQSFFNDRESSIFIEPKIEGNER